ncbi:MAG: ribosomal RNA small subunit methyltransferase A [Bacteroidetes bacterium]|nr:ribosomal RNA small subunit methyltransferase A [Bacteroidota bacterium]
MYRPRKSLGQNFLQDENILRKIIDYLHLQNGDAVVEIGPGQGALTKHLILQPVTLIGIDIDERAIALLRETIGEKAIFIQADVLDVDLKKLFDKCGKKLRIIGNIPYYLTSEILFWLFDARKYITDAVIMMQLEVARRLIAPPKNKEYGILSVFAQFYTECELLFKVSKNCFYPKPEVDSAVVHLNFKKTLPHVDEKMLRSVVRATFGKRRKTLRNGLKSLDYEDTVLDRLPFDLKKRPEELSVNEFVELTESIRKILYA